MRATAVKYVLTQRLWNLFCKYSGIVKTYYARNERQIVLQTFHDLTCCSKVLINTKNDGKKGRTNIESFTWLNQER